MPASSHDGQDRWYGIYETPEVIVYNSDAITADQAPRDWDDVLNERWRDKVLIRNPNPSDSMRAIFGAMIWRFYRETGPPEKGYDWPRRLDQSLEPARRLVLQTERIALGVCDSSEWHPSDFGRHRGSTRRA